MFLHNNAKHKMLDALDEGVAGGATHASLHTAYSATGANEVTGGSPAYARKALTWAAASGGSKAISGAVTFDVPASTTVRWVGLFDALTTGNFLGMAPAGGGALKPFAVDDTTADTLKSEAHGFSNGQEVVVWGPALPSDLAVGTVYYVVSAATDSLQLSATSGGAAINFTDKGHGFLQRLVPETFGAQGTYQLSALSLTPGAVS